MDEKKAEEKFEEIWKENGELICSFNSNDIKAIALEFFKCGMEVDSE